ncbi:MAG: hypothetical protein KAU28_02565, partial [Phycisphaerae bacterium]|nr:hypothetical protein [Phycisphaerae bacterium]
MTTEIVKQRSTTSCVPRTVMLHAARTHLCMMVIAAGLVSCGPAGHAGATPEQEGRSSVVSFNSDADLIVWVRPPDYEPIRIQAMFQISGPDGKPIILAARTPLATAMTIPDGYTWGVTAESGEDVPAAIADAARHGAPFVTLEGLTDETLPLLAKLNKAKGLSLGLWGQEPIAASGLAALGELSQLRYLEIRNDSGEGIAPSLAFLEGLVELEKLSLPDFELTKDNLVHLKGLPKLRELSIGWLSRDGLLALKELKQVKRLSVSLAYESESSYLDDVESSVFEYPSLAELGEMPNVESFRLNWGGTDSDMAMLAAFPNLKELSVGSAIRVTDEGMRELGKLTQLKSLVIGRLLNITDAG